MHRNISRENHYIWEVFTNIQVMIKTQFNEALSVLQAFIEGAGNFDRIEQAATLMTEALKSDKKIISCGNGGSMCDAMHFAEELSGRFRDDRPGLAAIAISDPGHLSCVGNDYGFRMFFHGTSKRWVNRAMCCWPSAPAETPKMFCLPSGQHIAGE